MQPSAPIVIRPARQEEAANIAQLIMMAMNHECCQNFAGPGHTLADFHRMMTQLVAMDHSQYSYLNTLVAETADGKLAGIVVSYDGALLRPLREAFLSAARQHLDRDFTGMADETQAGEHYIDSLAVDASFRHQGIASQLLRAVIDRHGGQQPVGLLVDQGNPDAERLYRRLGFQMVDETQWGGHPMKHLQRLCK